MNSKSIKSIFGTHRKSKSANVMLKPEAESAFVRIAQKISASDSGSIVVKIEGKYFRVKELG